MSELFKVIQALIESGIPEPKFYSMFLTVFKYESYYKWTLDEIRRYAVEHPNWSAETILERFIFKMGNEACNAKDPDVRYMFSTAEDTAKYVLDEYIATIERYYNTKRRA